MSDRPAQQMPKCPRRMNIFNSLHIWTRLSGQRSRDLPPSTTCNSMVADRAEPKIASHTTTPLYKPTGRWHTGVLGCNSLQLQVVCVGWAWQPLCTEMEAASFTKTHDLSYNQTHGQQTKERALQNMHCMRHKQMCSRAGCSPPQDRRGTSTKQRCKPSP
jgi:hypothetical protein